jgi:hypothetical protein
VSVSSRISLPSTMKAIRLHLKAHAGHGFHFIESFGQILCFNSRSLCRHA